MTESNKRQCIGIDTVRDTIFNCLCTSFGGVFVLCDIVLEYAKVVLFIHERPGNEYTILEFYECDLPQSPRVFKHIVNTDPLPVYHELQINYYTRQIGSRFRVVMTLEHGNEYCREVIDSEDKSSISLNMLIETGPYGNRPILVTNTSILFFSLCPQVGNKGCIEWDPLTHQLTNYLLELNGCIRPLCANERFIVFQKADYLEGWRRVLIFKRDGVEQNLVPTEICICTNERCKLFINRLIGMFHPDDNARMFLIYHVKNEDSTTFYLLDVINLDNGITVIHKCCDKPALQLGNEHCSFYPPLTA